MKQPDSLFRRAAGFFSAMAFLAAVHAAQAQGTAFTYQGRLNNGASTANGSYDLTFALFDRAAAGNQVGGPLTNTAVGVSNGLFVVILDFGAGMFDGTPRWLEIGVGTNASGTFTILSPRQALTPTPYAIYAANAATAASVAAGSVAPDQLATPAPPADGQVLAFTGGSLQWTDPAVAGGSVWSTNGTSAYYSAGNVGIGTASPVTALEVNGLVRSTRIGLAPQYIELNGGDPGSIKLTAQSVVAAEKNLFIQNLSGEATPGPNNNMQFVLGTTASPSVKMTLTKDGNVVLPLGGSGGGMTIGTPAGETGISMVGANRADVRFDGLTLKLLASAGVGIPSSANGIAINTLGNVGVGTDNPIAKLDVENPLPGQSAVFGHEPGTFGVGVYGSAASPSGIGVVALNISGVALQVDGDATQMRTKSGLVKAMVVVAANGTISRAYNAVTGASGGAAGFSINNLGNGLFGIDFGFQVDDRFVSVTPGMGELSNGRFAGGTTASVLYGYQPTFIGESHPNSIFVQLGLPPDSGVGFAPASFTVIVY